MGGCICTAYWIWTAKHCFATTEAMSHDSVKINQLVVFDVRRSTAYGIWTAKHCFARTKPVSSIQKRSISGIVIRIKNIHCTCTAYGIWTAKHCFATTEAVSYDSIKIQQLVVFDVRRSTAYGIWTRATAVKGRRPRPLDERGLLLYLSWESRSAF